MAEKEHTGMGSVIAALGANVLVAISKFVGYALSGSAAMLNESIHSLVDCGNQVLLLLVISVPKEHKAISILLEKRVQNTF